MDEMSVRARWRDGFRGSFFSFSYCPSWLRGWMKCLHSWGGGSTGKLKMKFFYVPIMFLICFHMFPIMFPKFSMFLRNFLIWEFRSPPPPPRCCYPSSQCSWGIFWFGNFDLLLLLLLAIAARIPDGNQQGVPEGDTPFKSWFLPSNADR